MHGACAWVQRGIFSCATALQGTHSKSRGSGLRTTRAKDSLASSKLAACGPPAAPDSRHVVAAWPCWMLAARRPFEVWAGKAHCAQACILAMP